MNLRVVNHFMTQWFKMILCFKKPHFDITKVVIIQSSQTVERGTGSPGKEETARTSQVHMGKNTLATKDWWQAPKYSSQVHTISQRSGTPVVVSSGSRRTSGGQAQNDTPNSQHQRLTLILSLYKTFSLYECTSPVSQRIF
ncbi:hypothetical protein GOODEAATRI_034221 [Goodea atripinnis]|uniref:Uncharacterized protein n=1 Tax=Goodea atripinnis TaxID=208336 RepID=A0ABV0MNH9_9TELE